MFRTDSPLRRAQCSCPSPSATRSRISGMSGSPYFTRLIELESDAFEVGLEPGQSEGHVNTAAGRDLRWRLDV